MGPSSPSAADHRLLAAWRAGDEGAFAVLVGRHHRVVRAACRRQLPERDVDDAVQAVFLVLARRPAAAARAPVLAAWLLRVAHLAARDLRRRERRRRRAEALAVPSVAPGHDPDAVQLDRLDAALMALRPAQRDALVLHVVEGAAPAEIADRLGTSRDHAYKLIQRGLAALRSRFGGVLPTTAALAAVLAPADGADGAGLVPVLTGTPSARARTVAAGIGSPHVPWLAAVIGTGLAVGVGIALAGAGSDTVPGAARPVPVGSAPAGAAPAPTATGEARDRFWDPAGSPRTPRGEEGVDSPGTVQAVGREQPPHGEEAARRFTLVVAGMRADHAATWLGELAQEPVILDPVLAGRRVDMDLTDASLAEAIAIFAAACDADAEALPGGGYRLRVRPTPRAQ